MTKLAEHQKTAIQAVKEYRNEIHIALLSLSKQLLNKLNKLLKDGIDKTLHVHLKDVSAKIEPDITYTSLDRKMVIECISILDKMNSENAIEMFSSISENDSKFYLYDYDEFILMLDLLSAGTLAKTAEESLTRLKLTTDCV